LAHNRHRLHCNTCANAISNLHYTCRGCEWDICARCARNARLKAGKRSVGCVNECQHLYYPWL
jgi:hypothetical protein